MSADPIRVYDESPTPYTDSPQPKATVNYNWHASFPENPHEL